MILEVMLSRALPCDAPLHAFVLGAAVLGLGMTLADFVADVFKDPMPPVTKIEQARAKDERRRRIHAYGWLSATVLVWGALGALLARSSRANARRLAPRAPTRVYAPYPPPLTSQLCNVLSPSRGGRLALAARFDNVRAHRANHLPHLASALPGLLCGRCRLAAAGRRSRHRLLHQWQVTNGAHTRELSGDERVHCDRLYHPRDSTAADE